MRDAQGQGYWQWCRAGDFVPVGDAAVWDEAAQALRLASALGRPPEPATLAQARAAAAPSPLAVDGYGGWARVSRSAERDRVVAGGATDPETEIWRPATDGVRVLDLVVTARDWLVILLDDGGIVVRDLLDRFEEIRLAEPGFSPDRAAESGDGTVWLLDRAGKALRRLEGQPLPTRTRRRERAPHMFQPRPLDPDPLRLTPPLAADLSPIADEILDACGLTGGGLAALTLGGDDSASVWQTDGVSVTGPERLGGIAGAFSLREYAPGRLAVLVPGAPRAVLAELTGGTQARLLGTILPLRDGTGGRLCATLPGAPVSYPAAPRRPVAGGPLRPFARLVAPSRPVYARRAHIRTRIMESDAPGTVWHRLYAEAHLPPDCAITLLVAAGDDPDRLAALPDAELHPHRIGAAPGEGPQAAWMDMDSERPWMGSATGAPRRRDRCGLWTVLIQAWRGDVRRIAGRYLRVDVHLSGPGLATPRLHALRAWGPRRAWRDRFLPQHLAVEEGDQARGSDFLDRYLALFESVLTPIEDEVAASYRLTRPDAAPADALDWLAGWIGAELDGALSETAKRRLLAQSVPLWRRRGTLQGLERVLDIVTDGGVTRGDLVVLEHFHLRRTFATILGADLSDAENPLTPWARESGNSHLGASFFLGDEDRRAFLALFRPGLLDDPLMTGAERADARADLAEFFDGHAYQVTVLVHAAMDRTRRDLIARVLEREIPAHVVATLAEGPGSLVLALSSLLGVDTRLGPRRPRRPLTLGEAEIGQVHLTDTPSLDPRFEGGA